MSWQKLISALPWARSLVCVGLQYDTPAPYSTESGAGGWIARYAWGDDYHDVMKAMLERLGARLRSDLGAGHTRHYVDTGPIVERAFAAAAGLGAWGKNSCLLHPEHGYYRTREAIWLGGDFITAPEISQMFGELLGLWAADYWQKLGSPSRCYLVKLGPGRVTLMRDALRAVRAAPAFRNAVQPLLVEASERLREIQHRALARERRVGQSRECLR